MFRTKPSQWKKKRPRDEAGGGESGSQLHLGPPEQEGTHRGGHRPTSPPREALRGQSPLETGILRNCQAGGAQASARARGTGNPCQSPPGLCQARLSSVAWRFCQGHNSTLWGDHPAFSRSPREQNHHSVCQWPPLLPGPLLLSPPCQGEREKQSGPHSVGTQGLVC